MTDYLNSDKLYPDDINRRIAHNLRRILAEEDTTATMLADWAGVHHNTVYRITSQERAARADTLYMLARILRRSMDEFFEESE